MNLDPVKRELIRNSLVMISDNMLVSVIRTARSIVVKNNFDFSASICDPNGQMVAQGLAVPGHLGAIMPPLKACLDAFGDDIGPGDIFANNDPFSGGSHLNDIFMYKPVYVSGRRVAILALILHHTDMGGRVPGGNAADSNEIYQEGLRIPPSKIYEAGAANQTLLRILEANVRVSDRLMGDIRAQVAALNAAEKEIHRLLEEYSFDEFNAYLGDIIDYSERLTRAGIRALPDGEAEFVEWNDDDGVGGGPVKIQLKLTIRGDEVIADFTGTSAQTGGSLHTNYWFTASCTYAALRTVLDPNVPNNAGFYRPITIIAPEGSWVNPIFPAAFGARGQGGYRVRSVVLGALAQILPNKMTACPGGSEFAIVIAGKRSDRKPFLHLEMHNTTGHGGGPDRDGQDAGPYCIGNLANTPVELLEAESPILVDCYEFLPDTGGPGKYRGALGIVRQYRILSDEALVQLRSDRRDFKCWGLFGGEGGVPARSWKNPDGNDREELPSKFIRTFKAGDVFRGEMAAAGGYGDPLERDPVAVFDDIRQDKMTLAHARDTYGVVLDAQNAAVDTARTQAARQKLHSRRSKK